MAKSRLHAVYELGQSVWYDNIRRGLITSGDLQRLIDDDAVVGITSNPTIFEKAIAGSEDYDDALRALVQQRTTDPRQAFFALAVEDIQMAADILRPTFDQTHHADGYISLEVSPDLANDTDATIAEARRLFQRVNRPNVMIKIPATAEGMPAIEQMIYEGVNINVTLIFALEAYEHVTEAFIRGLERRVAEGKPVDAIASVASFFVSRVDTLVDKQLDGKIAATSDDGERERLRSLQGKAAIANARLAYARFGAIFHGERFAPLLAAGARPQRCLWASTSTKNPAYRDVLYVEDLLVPETVDTMPPQTIVAFQEHGEARRAPDGFDEARQTMEALAMAGIDMAQVTRQLEVDGVASFTDSFNALLASTGKKIETLAAQMSATPPSAQSVPEGQASLGPLVGAVEETLGRARNEQFARRVWAKEPAFWKPDPSQQSEITDRLGWLTVMDTMRDALPRLNDLRDSLAKAGVTSAVLLGMGGSSLAPEVLRETFGAGAGLPDLITLDSTDPATILAVERKIDLARTVFIVASKSGGTLETLSQYKYFYAKVLALHEGDAASAGAQFIAITDPGTKLEALAADRQFLTTFRNPADIGGRYSALSFFGLVPAAIIGVDVGKLLDRADAMRQACAPNVEGAENPGVWLGTVFGAGALHGRDKVTIFVSPPIATFGYWLEQLIAESTGKEGKGILPVEGETTGDPNVYGQDRIFVYLRTETGSDPAQDAAVARLQAAGQPVVRLALRDVYDMGAEFFRWEFATAIAGALIGINAFDQPNVQESKDNTDRILATYARERTLREPNPTLRTTSGAVTLIAQGEREAALSQAQSLQEAVTTLAHEAGPGDYFALLAYIQRTPETEAALQRIRLRLRDLRAVATTLGYGPRFQHSTGQLHKGGPNTGVFVQFVARDAVDATIPGAPYTFGTLKAAQALGDLQSLIAHGRRAVRIDLGAHIATGLAELEQALDAIKS
ncbi:MAG TPA: bifunctional transaldolase/phosoglucose isomerase [Ktedonobacterales bacterium]